MQIGQRRRRVGCRGTQPALQQNMAQTGLLCFTAPVPPPVPGMAVMAGTASGPNVAPSECGPQGSFQMGLGSWAGGGGQTPVRDISSGCGFFTGQWTVTHPFLRVLRRVNAFGWPLRPMFLVVSLPR